MLLGIAGHVISNILSFGSFGAACGGDADSPTSTNSPHFEQKRSTSGTEKGQMPCIINMFNHRCAALLFVPGWACKSFVGAPQHQMQDITGCVLAAAMDRSNTTNQKITASKHLGWAGLGPEIFLQPQVKHPRHV